MSINSLIWCCLDSPYLHAIHIFLPKQFDFQILFLCNLSILQTYWFLFFMSIYEVEGNWGGLFCSRQGFAQVQYSLELTMYPRLASDLQQSCLILQSSGIIGMSRHTDLESKASREFLSVPSPFQWCRLHRLVSETHIEANTMFCSKAFGDTFCGLVLHYRRMSSQQYRFSSCPSRIIFLHLALWWGLNSEKNLTNYQPSYSRFCIPLHS